MKIPPDVLTAPDPQVAYAAYKAALAAKHKVTMDQVEKHYTADLLDAALGFRRIQEKLWPDAPANCYIYASFNRPVYEYWTRLPAGACTSPEFQADWSALRPWTYLATLEPCTWASDMRLIRVPLDALL